MSAAKKDKSAAWPLPPFEGQDVLSTTIAITNAGDGLSAAMKVDPKEMHLGDTVHIIIEAEVAKVRHEPIKDTEGLQRVHVLKAGRATMIDGAAVADALDEQDRRLERAAGIRSIFDDDGEPVEPEELAEAD